MRRKNRKWVAAAVMLYLFVMWSAYRWGASLRTPGGNIFVRLEREGIRRQQEEAAKAAKEQGPRSPNAEARLNAAGPAYVAARYDSTHVVFVVTADAESRFSNSPFHRNSGAPTRIPPPAKPSAPLAGLQELWEPDSQSLHFFPKIVQQTHPGDQWSLNVLPGWTIPVMIERMIIAPTGCSLALGFLAKVPSGYEGTFNGSMHDYFLVRRNLVELAQPPLSGRVGEIPLWKVSPAAAQQIERELYSHMKDEVVKIDVRLVENAASPGATSVPLPIGDPRPRLKEWLHADQALALGKGVLDYDVRAFHLTPDYVPRLYVRARWTLNGAAVFLMTAWFKVLLTPPQALELLWTDTSWSLAMHNGEAAVSLGDRLDFQSILNEFDADADGWAELLVHSYDGASTIIAPYLYTDKGLVSMKTPLRRDALSPESCLDP